MLAYRRTIVFRESVCPARRCEVRIDDQWRIYLSRRTEPDSTRAWGPAMHIYGAFRHQLWTTTRASIEGSGRWGPSRGVSL